MLLTGADLLTQKQKDRLDDLFAVDAHSDVQATWDIYQQMITAYREPDWARGRELMTALIEAISHSVPTALTEIATLGRTLKRRAANVLAYFETRHIQRTHRSDQRTTRMSRVRLCGRTIESVLKESQTYGKTTIDSGGEEDPNCVERDCRRAHCR